MSTRVYVDEFNLYYGALRVGKHCLWANTRLEVVGRKNDEGPRNRLAVFAPENGALTHREKGSDVNLGAHLLNDAWKGLFDASVIRLQPSFSANMHPPIKGMSVVILR